jgi:hypothetical protein
MTLFREEDPREREPASELKKSLNRIELELSAERAGLPIICCGNCAAFNTCADKAAGNGCEDHVMMAPMTRNNCTFAGTMYCRENEPGTTCPCGKWTDVPREKATP